MTSYERVVRGLKAVIRSQRHRIYDLNRENIELSETCAFLNLSEKTFNDADSITDSRASTADDIIEFDLNALTSITGKSSKRKKLEIPGVETKPRRKAAPRKKKEPVLATIQEIPVALVNQQQEIHQLQEIQPPYESVDEIFRDDNSLIA